MASNGKFIADIVKNVVLSVAGQTNKAFESMTITFDKIWNIFKNEALILLKLVLQKLNKIVSSQRFRTFYFGDYINSYNIFRLFRNYK